MKLITAALVMACITGCSNRTAFESIQAGNRHQCSKLPPSQYDECIERVSKTFDEYDNERKETLK